jgi:hypothetical protein
MKWWTLRNDDEAIDIPFLSLKDQDMLESVSPHYLSKYSSLYELVAITVIKGRLLLDVMTFISALDTWLLCSVRSLCVVRKLSGKYPVMLNVVKFLWPQLPCLSIKSLMSRMHCTDVDDATAMPALMALLRKLQVDLQEQVDSLLRTGDLINTHLWSSIVDPTDVFNKPSPRSYSHGSAEEVQIVARTAYIAITVADEEAHEKLIKKWVVTRK